MIESQGENQKLKQFLLGSLSPDEADEIGVRLIGDHAFDEELNLVENEIIEDFLDGALSTEETELFYKHFLTTSERIRLLEETALLKKAAKTYFKKNAIEPSEEKKRTGFFEAIKGFLTLNLRPVAAVLIIVVIGAIVWRTVFYKANDFSAIEKEYAALNSKDLNNAPETGNLTSKSLIAGTFRNTNETSKLKSANLTENVLFRLALPSETPKDALFNLELIKAGQTVFRQNDLRVYQNQNGQELKVVLPKSVLPTGDYQIKLNNGSTYGFEVE